MPSIDPDRLHAHRRTQADAGWPLLKASPSTFAARLVRYLDGLTPADVSRLMDAWEAFDGVPKDPSATVVELNAIMERFPAYAAFCNARSEGLKQRSVMTLPIKVVAGSLEETGGDLKAWGKLIHLGPEDIELRPPLATTPADLVPIPPKQLRQKIADMAAARFAARPERLSSEATRYTGALGDWRVALDVHYVSNRGWRRSHQFNYMLWIAPPEGKALNLQGYEFLWGLPAEWDWITVENAERCLAHLGTLVEEMAGLVRA